MPDGKPWEKYAQQQGPWTKYQSAPSNTDQLKTGAGMVAPTAPTPKVDMKTSVAPEVARGVGYVLPAIAGIGGAVLGAPAFGGGAAVGAGLGSAAGESARLAMFKSLFDEGPSPSSKEGLKQTAMVGGTSALLEVPGSLVSMAGKSVVKNIALSKSPQQVGDVIEGLMQSRPSGLASKTLQRDLMLTHRELSKHLGEVLSSAQGTADIDLALQPMRQEAAQISQSTPELRATARQVDKLIAAAKVNAGITGNQVSATQLMQFQNALKKVGYEAKPGPVGKVVQNLLQKGYAGVGGEVRQLAPESDQLLKQMTNIHAARNAVKNYAPGRAASLAASAYLHPRATAIISPIATVAGVTGAYKMAPDAKKVAEEVLP